MRENEIEIRTTSFKYENMAGDKKEEDVELRDDLMSLKKRKIGVKKTPWKSEHEEKSYSPSDMKRRRNTTQKAGDAVVYDHSHVRVAFHNGNKEQKHSGEKIQL